MWSPAWVFDDATFDRTAGSFDNPDFVDVVLHSYRHRTGNVVGDPGYAAVEARLAAQPDIDVPATNLHGAADGVTPVRSHWGARQTFHRGLSAPRIEENVGHNVPQEAPQAFADAILQLCKDASA